MILYTQGGVLMNKTEFRKKVFPLTKKEFYYLSNQKNISSKNYFDQESDTFDDFPNDQVLNLQGNLSQRLSITKNHHALFFDGQKTPIEMSLFTLEIIWKLNIYILEVV